MTLDQTHPAQRILPAAALWIGGEAIAQSSGGSGVHINPADGQPVGSFPLAGEAEVDAAVQAARRALPAWRRMPAPQRRNLLLAIADRLVAEAPRMAAIGALDAGTPVMIGAALSSAVPADWFRYYAGWADKLDGNVPASTDAGSFWYTRRVPYGVVGIIVAFNAPMAFIGMKVAAALAAGNTVVVKPSELAPWAVLRFAEICRDVGLPAGVLNVVPGEQPAGQALVTHRGVDRLTFTGSDGTARAIMRAAAETLTPVSFELGGKSASIIFDDARLENAAALSVQGSIALLSGQACIAGTRILAQRKVYDEVVRQVCAVAAALPVGDPLQPGTVVGPVINEFHCQRIQGVIERAQRQREGRLVSGGERLGGGLRAGYYLQPTVFADVDPQSALARDEIFGPVIGVMPFDTEEEAIEMANDSRYGLAGYLHTENLGRAHRVAQAIEAGVVTVNSGFTVPCNVPFGGFKSSGFGREGGPDGILEMTHSHSIQIGLN